MKKISTLLLFSCLFFGAAVSQNLEINGKGSYKSTWLFNNNISNAGPEMDYAAGWGYNYGVGATFFFNEALGLGFDLLMNTHNGNYTGELNKFTTYNSRIELQSMDIPILFKARSSMGGFLEIGPQISLINKATFYGDMTVRDSATNTSKTDHITGNVDTSYTSTNVSAVLGLGIKIKITHRIGIITGLRFEYGLTDLQGVDGLGLALKNSFFYPKYESTHSAAGSVFVGASLLLGKIPD